MVVILRKFRLLLCLGLRSLLIVHYKLHHVFYCCCIESAVCQSFLFNVVYEKLRTMFLIVGLKFHFSCFIVNSSLLYYVDFKRLNIYQVGVHFLIDITLMFFFTFLRGRGIVAGSDLSGFIK